MRNRKTLRPISETNNTLELNRTYVLSYVWDNDYFNPKSPTATFTGKEIYEALIALSESSDKELPEYNEHLYQLIKISGRVQSNRKLSSAHCPELILRASRVYMGCEDSLAELRREMAIYIGFHLDEIQDIDAVIVFDDSEAIDFTEPNPLVLFFYDYEDDELSDDSFSRAMRTQPASNIVQFPPL